MTPTRSIVLLLSISCAFLLGREFARRAVDPELPSPAYDVQVKTASNAAAALIRAGGAVVQTPTFVEVADRLRPSVVSISGISTTAGIDTVTSSGTGIVFSADGAVLTNAHVIEGSGKIVVTLSSGDFYPASVIGEDEPTDLAVLKIEGVTGLFPAAFGDSDATRVAEDVLAIGNPFGLGWTVTRGIVSSLHRSGLSPDPTDMRPMKRAGPALYTDYIQTDAAINFGNSGGPLVNAKGEVIGINTAIISRQASESMNYGTGIGIAIPANDAKFVANELLQRRRVRRGYLGFEGADLTLLSNQVRRKLSPSSGSGARVTKVEPNTPASRAGLQVDDVILALDGKSIESFQTLRNRVARIAPLTQVVLRVVRDGEDHNLPAVIGEYPMTEREE